MTVDDFAKQVGATMRAYVPLLNPKERAMLLQVLTNIVTPTRVRRRRGRQPVKKTCRGCGFSTTSSSTHCCYCPGRRLHPVVVPPRRRRWRRGLRGRRGRR